MHSANSDALRQDMSRLIPAGIIALKHLQGKHNQKKHGYRGGAAISNAASKPKYEPFKDGKEAGLFWVSLSEDLKTEIYNGLMKSNYQGDWISWLDHWRAENWAKTMPGKQKPVKEKPLPLQKAIQISDKPGSLPGQVAGTKQNPSSWTDKQCEEIRNGVGVRSDGNDGSMLALMQINGFAGKPQLLTKAALDAEIANGSKETFRGFGAANEVDSKGNPKAIMEFQSGELSFVGQGIFGNGFYTSDSSGILAQYARPYGTRMALSKTAKVKQFEAVNKEMNTELTKLYAKDSKYKNLTEKQFEALRWVFTDTGRFAAYKGYDAISIKNPGDKGGGGSYNKEFIIIINRTAISVQDSFFNMNTNDWVSAAKEMAFKHLQGQHNQKKHGNRGGRQLSTEAISGLSKASNDYYQSLSKSDQVKFRLAWYREKKKNPAADDAQFTANFASGRSAGTKFADVNEVNAWQASLTRLEQDEFLDAWSVYNANIPAGNMQFALDVVKFANQYYPKMAPGPISAMLQRFSTISDVSDWRDALSLPSSTEFIKEWQDYVQKQGGAISASDLVKFANAYAAREALEKTPAKLNSLVDVSDYIDKLSTSDALDYKNFMLGVPNSKGLNAAISFANYHYARSQKVAQAAATTAAAAAAATAAPAVKPVQAAPASTGMTLAQAKNWYSGMTQIEKNRFRTAWFHEQKKNPNADYATFATQYQTKKAGKPVQPAAQGTPKTPKTPSKFTNYAQAQKYIQGFSSADAAVFGKLMADYMLRPKAMQKQGTDAVVEVANQMLQLQKPPKAPSQVSGTKPYTPGGKITSSNIKSYFRTLTQQQQSNFVNDWNAYHQANPTAQMADYADKWNKALTNAAKIQAKPITTVAQAVKFVSSLDAGQLAEFHGRYHYSAAPGKGSSGRYKRFYLNEVSNFQKEILSGQHPASGQPVPVKTGWVSGQYKPAQKADWTKWDADTTWEIVKGTPRDPNKTYSGDGSLQALLKAQGMTEKPNVVDHKTFEQLKSSGEQVVYRGIYSQTDQNGHPQAIKDMMEGRNEFAGQGVFGNGHYTSDSPRILNEYGAYGMRLAIHKNAKIIDFDDLIDAKIALRNEFYSGAGTKYQRDAMDVVLQDNGRVAAYLGYDGYHVSDPTNRSYGASGTSNKGFWVMLNTSAFSMDMNYYSKYGGYDPSDLDSWAQMSFKEFPIDAWEKAAKGLTRKITNSPAVDAFRKRRMELWTKK